MLEKTVCTSRLEKMKAAGLNTVTTYIPWNLHEPKKGKYQLDGRFWNIPKFIREVSFTAGTRKRVAKDRCILSIVEKCPCESIP